ncbi:MAG: ABC transporter permease [bacterium]
MKTVFYFVKKEFLQFKRDPKMFAIILFAPIIQLVFLGYAATMDVNIVHTAVFNQDKSVTERKFIEKFEKSGYFSIDYYVDSYDELTNLINDGKILVAIVIPKDFEKGISTNSLVTVQALFDGSDGNKSSIAAGYVQSIAFDYAKQIQLDFKNKMGIKVNPLPHISAETRVWYNPELKTRNFMVPGIVGLLLMLVTLILTSLAIVKEKEIGTLEQLIVSPIKPYQMILGKLIPFTILGFVAVIIVITAMRVIFDIPVRGSIVLLFFSSFIYILSLLGLGLFVSTISKTQQQAMMLAIFAVMMPMVFLSGFSFPIENMPKVIQVITYIIPLRYFMTIIRGIVLKGIGLNELWPEIIILFAMGVSILFLSALRFRKKLE